VSRRLVALRMGGLLASQSGDEPEVRIGIGA
jgi:hypothetical protein